MVCALPRLCIRQIAQSASRKVASAPSACSAWTSLIMLAPASSVARNGDHERPDSTRLAAVRSAVAERQKGQQRCPFALGEEPLRYFGSGAGVPVGAGALGELSGGGEGGAADCVGLGGRGGRPAM